MDWFSPSPRPPQHGTTDCLAVMIITTSYFYIQQITRTRSFYSRLFIQTRGIFIVFYSR